MQSEHSTNMDNLDQPVWYQKPHILLMITAAAMPISFVSWSTLINNFAVEQAAFSGREIGILQSLREVPGFLSFLVVYLLLFMREQRLSLIALGLLGLGTAMTGYYPSIIGLYITTVIASIGFHYYETCHQSLAMQWLDKKTAPMMLGRIYGVASMAQVVTLLAIFLMVIMLTPGFEASMLLYGEAVPSSLGSYQIMYVVFGVTTLGMALVGYFYFPFFKIGSSHWNSTGIGFKKRNRAPAFLFTKLHHEF